MTTPDPMTTTNETCPWCDAEQDPPEDQDFGPGGYSCGSAVVPGEPKEESGFQSDRCRLRCLTKALADAQSRIQEAISTIDLENRMHTPDPKPADEGQITKEDCCPKCGAPYSELLTEANQAFGGQGKIWECGEREGNEEQAPGCQIRQQAGEIERLERENVSIKEELAHMRTSEAIQDREALRENVERLEKELAATRLRLLSAAGDDLACRELPNLLLGQPAEAASQHSRPGCNLLMESFAGRQEFFLGRNLDLTLAQLIAENEKLRRRAESAGCPFCGETDFDLIGLKHHLEAGHCAAYSATAGVTNDR